MSEQWISVKDRLPEPTKTHCTIGIEELASLKSRLEAAELLVAGLRSDKRYVDFLERMNGSLHTSTACQTQWAELHQTGQEIIRGATAREVIHAALFREEAGRKGGAS